MTVNRDTARRLSARARAASLVLLAAAGAVIALPMPALRPAATSAAITEPVAADADAGKATAAEPPIDLDLAISVLWAFSPPPAESAPADVAQKPPEGQTPPPATAATPPAVEQGWRYIGSIMGPRGMHALMEREGRQKLVRAGDRLDGGRVVAIEVEHVTLDEGRGPKHIKLAERASRWEATGSGPADSATVVGGRTMPGMAPNRPGQPMRASTYPAAPPQRNPYTYSSEMTDEEREKYELEKLERYREAGEAGEDAGVEQSEDGSER